jgi:hypothetical protein
MSTKRTHSPPRTPPPQAKRGRSGTPDTESTVVVGSVNSDKTKSTVIDVSPSQELYMSPSMKSSAHYSQQASLGMQTPTTVPGSLPTGEYVYGKCGVIGRVAIQKSNTGPISPITPGGSVLRKHIRKNGGKKTRSTRKNKSKRSRCK